MPEQGSQCPGKEVNARARRHDSESHGFKSLCQQKLFSHEISVKVCLNNNLAVELVYWIDVLNISHLYMLLMYLQFQ